MDGTNPHRLPTGATPSAYRLSIDTSIAEGRFSGTVSIDVDVTAATSVLVCNAAGLEVTAGSVVIAGVRSDATVETDASTERLVVHLGREIEPGAATVDLSFSGELNDQLVGFYRSTFEVDGQVHTMGVTQFEAPYARRAFPCWDEPRFKATFEIGLTCDAGLTAVSNSREVARTPLGDGRTRFEFAPTMAMSTYLVAWVIGELEFSRTVRSGDTDIRVVHRPGQAGLTEFALECAGHAVGWFEEYYGIAYPGDKLDLIAVPDFAFGAMENLGCVTFRDTLLLLDPDRASRGEQERAATVIEHEIAHMWFGDLVTMDWWNGIWLNEAFATFMEFCCADDFRPGWDIWTSFGLAKSQAFDTDALGHTRPIEFEVVTPADAEAMFDILTYEKGASVLRMFEQWAGPEAFREGVRTYLERHSYSNTDTPDLWSALAEATGIDVGAMMNTWILQGGHPLVTATATDSGISLQQQRFGFDGGDPVAPTSWIVPVRVVAGRGDTTIERTVLLDADPVEVDLGGACDTITINSRFTGFYRSEYSAELHDAALAALPDVSALDRYALLDDAWALFLAGRTDLRSLQTTLRAVARVEVEASVWRRIGVIVATLNSAASDDVRPSVATFVRELVAGRLLLAEESGDLDLHAVLFRLCGTVGRSPEVVGRARSLFADLGSVAGNPDLGAAVLDVVAANGDAAEFERVVTLYRSAETPQDEMRALAALAQFGDPELSRRFCEMCVDEVRTQNAPYALAQAMANPLTGPSVWGFIAERWDALLERFPSSSITRMVGGIRSFADPDVAAAVEEFFTLHEVPNSPLTLDQHLERMRVHVATRRRLQAAGPLLDR